MIGYTDDRLWASGGAAPVGRSRYSTWCSVEKIFSPLDENVVFVYFVVTTIGALLSLSFC
jgi:hypothetical protein